MPVEKGRKEVRKDASIRVLGSYTAALVHLANSGFMTKAVADGLMSTLPPLIGQLEETTTDRGELYQELQPTLQRLITVAENIDDVVLTDEIEDFIAESKAHGLEFDEPGTKPPSFWDNFWVSMDRMFILGAYTVATVLVVVISVPMILATDPVVQLAGIALPICFGAVAVYVPLRWKLKREQKRLEVLRELNRNRFGRRIKPATPEETVAWATALSLRRSGEVDAVIRGWRNLLRISQEPSIVRYNLGVDMLAMGKVAEGMQTIMEAFSENPDLTKQLETIVPESLESMPPSRTSRRPVQ